MAVKIAQELIDDIWRAMWLDNRKSGGTITSRYYADAIKDGWMSVNDIENIVCDFDGRIDDALYRFSFADALKEFGYFPQPIFPRPRVKDKEVWSMTCEIPVSDAVAFFISLQALGFDIDPKLIALDLMEQIRKKERVTRSEMQIVFYARNQLRSSIMLQSNGERQGIGGFERRKLTSGKKVDAYLWNSGSVYHLTVSGKGRAARLAA